MTLTATDYMLNTIILKNGPRVELPGAEGVCPRCNIHAFEGEVQELFGYRNMKRTNKDGETRIVTRAQSHCRECRSAERKAKRVS